MFFEGHFLWNVEYVPGSVTADAFSLSGLQKFNSIQWKDLRPYLLKKLVDFTEELVQSIAKVGLCYLLTPSSTSFVKSEYFSMDCCGTGNRREKVSFLCLCLEARQLYPESSVISSSLTKAWDVVKGTEWVNKPHALMLWTWLNMGRPSGVRKGISLTSSSFSNVRFLFYNSRFLGVSQKEFLHWQSWLTLRIAKSAGLNDPGHFSPSGPIKMRAAPYFWS